MRALAARAVHAVAASVVGLPPGEPRESAGLSRRRLATVLTIPVGAVLLRASLSRPPSDPAFYLLTGAVAVTWTVGGLLSGPLRLGWLVRDGERRRPVVLPVLTGLVAAATVVAAALIAREIPPLHADLAGVLSHAPHGAVLAVGALTLLNGAAEEVFFRGCVYPAAGGRHPVVVSTAVYALVVAVTGSFVLVLAAVALGLLLGLQRRATGGILAPILTHLSWSACTLPALSWLFAR